MKIQQYKKKFTICKDDNGKVIYKGDTVKIWLPSETSKGHTSVVYFNMVDGAFIKGSPAHSFMNEGRQSYRKLRDYLNQESIPMHAFGVDEPIPTKGYCIKVKSFNKK
jgi:hypothetical protein